jgi:hypothetical protein
VCARVTADLRDPVPGGHGVDSAAALDHVLLGRGALRGDEDLVLALGADRSRRHLHVLVLQRALGAQAEVDLFRERDGERVALDRCAELALRRLDRRELPAMASRRCLGKGARLGGCGLGALRVEAPVAGEAPRAAHQHAHADSLGLRVVEPLDALVAGSDHLRAPDDHARVRVGRPRAESCGYCVLAELPHTSYISARPRHEEGVATMPSRAGGGIGRRARLRALWG